MKSAIVTGATGFVGSWLVKELITHGVRVYAVVRPGSKNMSRLENLNLVQIIPCDLKRLGDLPKKIAERNIDVLYHLAWEGSAGCMRADTRLQLANVQYTVDAVRIAKQLGCSRFVGSGSIMETETISTVRKQGSQPGTGYIYGAAKLMAHCLSKAVATQIGIEHVWPMITNAYGEGELSPRFINTTLQKIIVKEPLSFTAATQNYDFVYVSDVARAFYLIGEKGKSFCEYLIGSSCARPLKEFIMTIGHELAPGQKLLFGDVPFTGTNLPLEAFDCSTTKNDTGFTPSVTFPQGVRKTMDWLLSFQKEKK